MGSSAYQQRHELHVDHNERSRLSDSGLVAIGEHATLQLNLIVPNQQGEQLLMLGRAHTLAFDMETKQAPNLNTNDDKGATMTAEEAVETIILMK